MKTNVGIGEREMRTFSALRRYERLLVSFSKLEHKHNLLLKVTH